MQGRGGQFEIFLQPGDMYFGESDTRIRTLLGSCVSVTAWHPGLRIGGMCHYVLGSRRRTRTGELDGRYADEAGLWFLREAARRDTRPNDYEFKIFGGGEMFGTGRGTRGVGGANALHGMETLERLGCRIVAKHVGGTGHRNLVFDIGSGHVWMRHVPLAVNSERTTAS